MTSMVAKASSSSCGSHVSTTLISVRDKGNRNKRKFRADQPVGDPNKIVSSTQTDGVCYEFSAEKFVAPVPSHACDLCCVGQNHSDDLKLDLGLSSTVGSSEFVGRRQLVKEDSCDADWGDLTELELEELVLSNLDAIFKSAIKKIVECGYTDEVATKAVLRPGLCYGCKDILSNIVENALLFLRNGHEVYHSAEHHFESLQQMEKFTLAELVCVLREVRPFFSIGDAMWCLLICDMNISRACSMDGDPSSGLTSDGNGSPSISSQPQITTEAKDSGLNFPHTCKHLQSVSCCSTEHTIPKNSSVDAVEKSFSFGGTCKAPMLEEKAVVSRKAHVSHTRKECSLRQKSLHLEKTYHAYGCKGSARASKMDGLGSLILDKKLKSIQDSMKNASLRLGKAMAADAAQNNGSQNIFSNPGLSSLNTCNTQAPLSGEEVELSLSLPIKDNTSLIPLIRNTEGPNGSFVDTPPKKSVISWPPEDNKDETIMKLLPKVRELQNQLQEWTEWANQKVMQAARRLSKDKAELKSLRQEKEEVERLKKEKQTLEENTMKKLTEMEKALCKASGQVERANAAVRRLDVENIALRQEMEAAKLRAAESAASCQEALQREKNTMVKFQSWEKQKALLVEELANEKRKAAELQQVLDQARQIQLQHEARLEAEQKAKEELVIQANTMKIERVQLEASYKSQEHAINSKAEAKLRKYKDDVEKLEKEISLLRLSRDSSKIAALVKGLNGSYASRLVDRESRKVMDVHDYLEKGGVKRERECVMCLSEEMSVVFLPCAHQVVCVTCNELHEKQGMKDCPSCRSTIQRRVPVRFSTRS